MNTLCSPLICLRDYLLWGLQCGIVLFIRSHLVTSWLLIVSLHSTVGEQTLLLMFDSFHTTHAYPSFNVKDLDTVDRAVRDHLLAGALLNDTTSSWDIAIGHMLGVDHCGHTYGPQHPEMGRKLLEVDALIRSVTARHPHPHH